MGFLDKIFGTELGLPARAIVALGLVLALIMITVWLMRRFNSGGLPTGASGRNRQQRLSVLDSAPVDARRRLVLIRRDNLEHLLLIGGPTDVVVEANIVRGAMPGTTGSRIQTPSRSGVFDLAEPEMQPDAPLIPSYNEPAYEERIRPVTQPQAPAPIPFRQIQETPRPAPMPAPAPQPAPAPMAAPVPPMPPIPQAGPIPHSHRAPAPASRAPEQPAYADMAKRLEDALRKPADAAPAPAPAPVQQAGPIPHSHRAPASEPRVFAPSQPGRTPPPVQRAPEPRPAPQQVQTPQHNSAADVFGNLEEEMASLLRQGGKTTQ